MLINQSTNIHLAPTLPTSMQVVGIQREKQNNLYLQGIIPLSLETIFNYINKYKVIYFKSTGSDRD